MAFGTWGGLGPEGAKVLHRLVKRAASWQEGELRALRQRELLETISLALMRQVWKLLGNKTLFLRLAPRHVLPKTGVDLAVVYLRWYICSPASPQG